LKKKNKQREFKIEKGIEKMFKNQAYITTRTLWLIWLGLDIYKLNVLYTFSAILGILFFFFLWNVFSWNGVIAVDLSGRGNRNINKNFRGIILRCLEGISIKVGEKKKRKVIRRNHLGGV
jgi:hypothetical protein